MRVRGTIRGMAATRRLMIALVYACAGIVSQTSDLVLHLQLAALEVRECDVVDRRMRQSFVQFAFQCFVLPFSSARCAWMDIDEASFVRFLTWGSLPESAWQVDGLLLCAAANTRDPDAASPRAT